MITSKRLKYIVFALMSLALVFAICITYFPNILNVESAASQVGMEYETELFKEDQIMTVEIIADDGDWQNMLDNAINEEYIRCDVVINGTTYKDVGIRPKGNTSLTSIASDPETDRYSFKIEFDHYISGQTCMGLDKLVLNNNYQDATYMKEFMSYELMAYMGVASPLHSYASISVNGESQGLYLALEAYEESFAMRNYGTSFGQLYKPESVSMGGGGMGIGGSQGGGTDLVYTDDELASYSNIFDMAVFEPTDKEKSVLIEALRNLNEGTDIETYVNVEATLRYCAVNTFLVNLDSYFGNLKHNYYLYEKSGQLTMLPWDYNLSFAGFQMNDGTDAVNFPIDSPVSGTTLDERPMIGKLLEVEEYAEMYHQYLRELVDGYIESGLFAEKIAEIDDLINEEVENDPTAFYSHDEYETAVTNLLLFGELRSESVSGQLAGMIPSTETAQAENADALIDGSSVNITAMGTQGGGNDMKNPAGRREMPSDGEMPVMENMPADGEMPDMENMPADGQMPDMENMPDDGEMPDMENMPTAGGVQQGREGFGGLNPTMEQAEATMASVIPSEYMIYIGIGMAALIAGTFFVVFFKRRKYHC